MQFLDNSESYGGIAVNGYRIRGYFINEIIVIERLMDRFIARHFTADPDRQMELITFFISTKRIAFEGKRQVFKFMVDNYYTDKFNDKDLMYTQLKKLEDFRNVLAHNILDTRAESMDDIKNGTIGFLKFENDTTLQTYDKEKIDGFKTMIINLQTQLYNALKNS